MLITPEERRRRILIRWQIHREIRNFAFANNFDYKKVLWLKKQIGINQMQKIVKLFTPQRRTYFERSLQRQVIEWFQEDFPQYLTPLSRVQMDCLGK